MLTKIEWRHNVQNFGEWVSVAYRIELLGSRNDPEVTVSHLADMYEAKRLGSGAGYGSRDIDYSFPDRDRAEGFVDALRARYSSAAFTESEG